MNSEDTKNSENFCMVTDFEKMEILKPKTSRRKSSVEGYFTKKVRE